MPTISVQADEALRTLAGAFLPGEKASEPNLGRLIPPEHVPAPYHGLLVHTEHMTAILRAHCGQPLRLHVLAERRDTSLYERMIVLSAGETGRLVELGIVRICLSVLPPAVTEAVLARRQPLGDILMQQDVLRRVQPRWFFEIPAESPLRAQYRRENTRPAYGRIANILVDGNPAIDLLEIVGPDASASPPGRRA